MKKLKLEFNNLGKDYIIQIDGKVENLKKQKGKRGKQIVEIETDKDAVNLSIKRIVPIGAKKWFWWQVLFYFVSVFGILDRNYNKKCYVIDYASTITLQEDINIKVLIHNSLKVEKVVELKTEATVEEHVNQIKVDKIAKKRLKGYTAVKIISWILLALGLGFLILNTLL